MSGWKKVKLGDVIENIVGGGTPSKKNETYWNGSIPWASVKDLSDNDFHLNETQDRITQEGLEHSSSNLIKKGTIILPTRMGLGRVVRSEIDVAINQDLKALYPKEEVIHPDYLLWLLVSLGKKIISLGTGSTVAGVRLTELKNIDFLLPNLKTQKSLAEIITAYDDLIENNQKRIKILEEIAQRLYTEWFVKFNFPGQENVKIVDSGTEFGEIPEGWEIGKIGSNLKTSPRKKKIKKSEYLSRGKYPIVDQGSDFISGRTNNADAVLDGNVIVFGDHTRVFKYCNFKFARGADGTQILDSNNKERLPNILLYYASIHAGLKDYKYARHFKFLKELKILLPSKDVSGVFEQIADDNYSLIHSLRLQNENLVKIRDLLIENLVTGKRSLKK